MKKQFYRVKQLADVRVGRAGKTDLLTEELQHVEKSMEKVKAACSVASKKLSSCMLSSGPDIERRKKKLNQLQLGQAMLECAQDLGDSTLLGGVLLTTGETQTAISGELATCEAQIDNDVLGPLSKLVEVEIPNIVTTKKKLSKARLDMDACKTRWLNSVKIAVPNAAAKADVLKIELEDETAKFESLQDTLATEMFTFMAGERTYAQWMVKLLEAQMNYHKAAAAVIEKCLPSIKQKIDDSIFRPVYGCRLEDHLRVTDREIAFVIEECVLFLLDVGMEVEGLFRIAGGALRIKKLKAAFDCGISDLGEFVNDVHSVAGALKMYLRELPEPLLTFELHDEWIAASSIKERDQRLQALWKLVEKLPAGNKANLRYLICFFAKLAENSDMNKMNASNIGIVFGPNLLWQHSDGGMSVANTGNLAGIVDTLVQHQEWFFPGGCAFARQQSSEELIDAFAQRFAREESPTDVPPVGGSFMSEMSKMFNFKENTAAGLAPGSYGSSAMQGYYNPLAAQFFDKPPDDEDNLGDGSSLGMAKAYPPFPTKPQAPLTEPVNLPYATHSRSTSESSSSHELTVDVTSCGQEAKFDQRSPLPKRSFSQGEKKEPPRRPAPPIPSGPKPKLSTLAEKPDAKHPHRSGDGTLHSTGEQLPDAARYKIEAK